MWVHSQALGVNRISMVDSLYFQWAAARHNVAHRRSDSIVVYNGKRSPEVAGNPVNRLSKLWFRSYPGDTVVALFFPQCSFYKSAKNFTLPAHLRATSAA
jgi:hypothetical protein